MVHIWKLTGYNKAKYGFNNRHALPPNLKYGIYMDTISKYKLYGNNMVD